MPFVQPSHCLSVADQKNVPDILKRQKDDDGTCGGFNSQRVLRCDCQNAWKKLHHTCGKHISAPRRALAQPRPQFSEKLLYGRNAQTKGVASSALNAAVVFFSSSVLHCGALLLKWIALKDISLWAGWLGDKTDNKLVVLVKDLDGWMPDCLLLHAWIVFKRLFKVLLLLFI